MLRSSNKTEEQNIDDFSEEELDRQIIELINERIANKIYIKTHLASDRKLFEKYLKEGKPKSFQNKTEEARYAFFEQLHPLPVKKKNPSGNKKRQAKKNKLLQEAAHQKMKLEAVINSNEEHIEAEEDPIEKKPRNLVRLLSTPFTQKTSSLSKTNPKSIKILAPEATSSDPVFPVKKALQLKVNTQQPKVEAVAPASAAKQSPAKKSYKDAFLKTSPSQPAKLPNNSMLAAPKPQFTMPVGYDTWTLHPKYQNWRNLAATFASDSSDVIRAVIERVNVGLLCNTLGETEKTSDRCVFALAAEKLPPETFKMMMDILDTLPETEQYQKSNLQTMLGCKDRPRQLFFFLLNLGLYQTGENILHFIRFFGLDYIQQISHRFESTLGDETIYKALHDFFLKINNHPYTKKEDEKIKQWAITQTKELFKEAANIETTYKDTSLVDTVFNKKGKITKPPQQSDHRSGLRKTK